MKRKFSNMYFWVKNDLLMHTNCIKNTAWQENWSGNFLSGECHIARSGNKIHVNYTCNDNCINSQMYTSVVLYVAIHKHSTFWMKQIHSVIYVTHYGYTVTYTCIDYKQVESPLSCDDWYILKKCYVRNVQFFFLSNIPW